MVIKKNLKPSELLIEVDEIDNCQKNWGNFDIDTLCCPNIKNNKITHLVDYENM